MGFFLQLPLSFAFPVMPFLTTCFLCCFHLKWHSRHFRFCWKVKASIFEESLICILANDSEGLSSLDVCHFERDDSHLSSLWSLYIKMLRQSKQILVWRRVGVQPPNSHRVSSNTLFPCQLSHEVSRRFVIAKLETRFALVSLRLHAVWSLCIFSLTGVSILVRYRYASWPSAAVWWIFNLELCRSTKWDVGTC
jgi:hypothetical protein